MNAGKRARPEQTKPGNGTIIIDLTSSDDEAPASKRQKSLPPAQSIIEAFQSTHLDGAARPVTPHPSHQGQQVSEKILSTVKKSPFRNKPAWLAEGVSRDKRDDRPVASVQRDQLKSMSLTGDIDRKVTSSNATRPDSRSTPFTREQRPFSSAPAPGFSLTSLKPLKFDTNATKSGFSRNASEPIKFSTDATITQTPTVKHNVSTHLQPQSSNQYTLPLPTAGQVPRVADPQSSNEKRRDVPKPIQISLPVRSPTPSSQPASNITAHPSQQSVTTPLVVNVPLTYDKQKRHNMIAKLKASVDYAKTHQQETASIVGLTSFDLNQYPLDDDISRQRYKNAAQPKKRKVNRDAVQLDFGRKKPTSGQIYTTGFVHPHEQVKTVLSERFSEVFDPPLTFSNEVNDRRLNGKFQFINDSILRKGVRTTGALREGPHECSMTCSGGTCGRSCSCTRKVVNVDDEEEWKRKPEYGPVPSYERRPDGLVVLTEEYVNDYSEREEIYECHDACGCSDFCTNRVVQHGRTIPLEIFQTAKCGFGVRSSVDIKRGQFIDTYRGEIITTRELERREEAAENDQPSYIYSLDWFPDQKLHHIDGEYFGSAMRFVNHSCSPNSKSFVVMNYKSTKSLYSVGFFAVKDISAGTEITIDYLPQNALEEDGDENIAERLAVMASQGSANVQECFCGEPNCRGRLWKPAKKTRKRHLNDD